MDNGYDVTKICYNCKGSGRVQLTQEEIRAKEEARLEEVRAKEEARLEEVRLKAERRRAEEARIEEFKKAIAFANSLAPSLKNSIGMELILIKPGKFRMGSDDGISNEKPVHEVVIMKSFYMGKYEVTQAQWRAVMGNDLSHFKGDSLPVDSVSFDDAKEFCKKLSQTTGQEYRLPTEAEWEYACRAGTTGDYAGNLDSMAWYDDNSSRQTHPVGQRQPNAFGLYDMHGNVWEWCEDVWHDSYYGAPMDGSAWLSGGDSSRRVLRGGSWDLVSGYCRSANRGNYAPGARDNSNGLRVVVSARIS